MTRQELCAALDAQLAAAQEQVCVLAVPLAGGVPLYERGAGRRAVSASTIKVFILLAALDEVRRGRLALDTPVSVTAEDILPDTGVFVDGPGMHPLEELLVWMIVLSDNTATNVLIGLLGAECINAAACSVGTKNTVLEHKVLDWDAVSAGRNNYTSAEDLLRVFRALYDETVLTPELCALARSILRRQRDTRMLTRYIWQDVPCAHKTGGLDRLSHDAGVFELPGRPYFIAVLIWDAPDIDGDEPLAGRVSKLVFDYYSQEDTQ